MQPIDKDRRTDVQNTTPHVAFWEIVCYARRSFWNHYRVAGN